MALEQNKGSRRPHGEQNKTAAEKKTGTLEIEKEMRRIGIFLSKGKRKKGNIQKRRRTIPMRREKEKGGLIIWMFCS